MKENGILNACKRCINRKYILIGGVIIAALIIIVPTIGVSALIVSLPFIGCTVMCGGMAFMMHKKNGT